MMDHERDHDREFEATLRAFRPLGPPESMQVPAELGQTTSATRNGARHVWVGSGALAAAAIIGLIVWSNLPAVDPSPASQPESRSALSPGERQAFLLEWENQPRVAFGLPTGGAEVVLVEFVDWLCPARGCTASVARQVADRYATEAPGAVRYVVSDFPINAECNPAVPKTTPGHEASCVAAAAVRLARARGRERGMIAWLGQRRPDLASLERSQAVASVKAEAARLLGTAPTEDEYAREIEAVRRDAANGSAIGITSVPTLYINGVRADVRRSWAAEYIDLAVELELARTSRQGVRHRASMHL